MNVITTPYASWDYYPQSSSPDADIEKTTTYNISTNQIGSSFLLNCKYQGFFNQTLVSLQWQLDNSLIYYKQFEKNRGRTLEDMAQFFEGNTLYPGGTVLNDRRGRDAGD